MQIANCARAVFAVRRAARSQAARRRFHVERRRFRHRTFHFHFPLLNFPLPALSAFAVTRAAPRAGGEAHDLRAFRTLSAEIGAQLGEAPGAEGAPESAAAVPGPPVSS